MTDPRFPIGTFKMPEPVGASQRAEWIDTIAQTPARLRTAIQGLSEAQFDTPYREGGWTVRQVIHHVPDSHMNAYVRFKLALTEDEPTVKPYSEGAWARLTDSSATPLEVSLTLLEALHERWVILLRSLSEADWRRAYIHPEAGRVGLERALGMYAWHGAHHVAHITGLRQQQGWV